MNVELLNSCSYVRSILETEKNIKLRTTEQGVKFKVLCHEINHKEPSRWSLMMNDVSTERDGDFLYFYLKAIFFKTFSDNHVWILKLHMTNINTFENRISSMDILPHFCPPQLWLRQLNKTTREVFSRPAMTNLQPSCPSLPHSLHKVCWNEAWWKVYGGCE